MRSKCYFDLNGQDESVIVAEITKSNDVRDKVAQRFYEALGTESNLALVRILPETEYYSEAQSVSNSVSRGPVTKNLEIVTVRGLPGPAAEMCRGLSIRQLEVLLEIIPKVLKEKCDEISPCMPPRKRSA